MSGKILKVEAITLVVVAVLCTFLLIIPHCLPQPGSRHITFFVDTALPRQRPINKGESFTIAIYVHTDYNLENMEIRFDIPPEVVVEKGDLSWKGRVKAHTRNLDIYWLWLNSRTDWTEWSRPVKIEIALDANGGGNNPAVVNGHYTNTITWSHKGYFEKGFKKQNNALTR